MAILSREQLVEAVAKKKLPRATIQVPELGAGAELLLQGMSGRQRDAWEKSLMVGRGNKRRVETENIRARLTAKSLINADGSRMFDDSEFTACAELLGELRADVLQRTFEAAQKLSGVSDEDIDELGKSSETAAG